MIRLSLTPECRGLLMQLGLAPELAESAVRNADRRLTDRRARRLVACQWLARDRILLVDGEVDEGGDPPVEDHAPVAEITAGLVLELHPDLPAGRLNAAMDLESTLAVVAESFAVPLTCDPDEPMSTLYSGPGRKERVVVHNGCIPRPYWLLGTFDAEESFCELVWAFRPDRYLAWRAEQR